MRKTVLVTGSSRGIGASIIKKFAMNNFDVIINYLNSENEALNLKKEIITKYNVKCETIKCDISKETDVISMAGFIKDKFGKIDVLVNNAGICNDMILDFKTYDKSILKKFSFDYMGFMPWIEEGIGIEALQKFNIKWDSYRNAIVIPNFDYEGNLIGIRERHFKPEEIVKGKYRPLFDSGILYNHPTGRTYYGIYENHKNIERKHMVVIFEGEKSVLRYGTIYSENNNIALATLGQNISKDHIQYLIKMKVTHVILAYDSDYEDYNQLKEVEQKYIEKVKILSPYFNVSYLMDYDFELPYKSSPIDGGREVFEHILKNRRIV